VVNNKKNIQKQSSHYFPQYRSLGEKRSFIELSTASTKMVITQELLNNVERIVNQKIVENIPVITHSQPNTDDTERPDSLPDDYMGGGIIRTIEIEGLDKNPCCGTHIRGLGQLQALKLLHTEKVRGGNTRVFFLFGQRVLDTLDANYAVARQLTSILSGGPETFVENVTKIQQQSKEHLKKAKRLLAALAGYAVKDIEVSLKETDCAFMYDEEADMEFVTMVAAIMKDRKVLDGTGKVVVLVAGPKKTGGPIIIAGDTDEVVQKTGKIVKETIPEVKGGGKGRWMGKSSCWSNIDALKQALEA
jgi:alanyl-tRNA synthetase